MTAVAPLARLLAQQVLQQESGGRVDALALALATERADERLRRQMTAVVGQAGYTALVSRALYLAQQDFPALQGVLVDAQAAGGLQGLREVAGASAGDLDGIRAGLSAILAQLFSLLVLFLGEELTLRLAYVVWPDLAETTRGAEEDG
ncbi:MAG TPA: hypothetical protein VIU62_02480 [Chloroflexota bacterium]|jgi:hypothetical protein